MTRLRNVTDEECYLTGVRSPAVSCVVFSSPFFPNFPPIQYEILTVWLLCLLCAAGNFYHVSLFFFSKTFNEVLWQNHHPLPPSPRPSPPSPGPIPFIFSWSGKADSIPPSSDHTVPQRDGPVIKQRDLWPPEEGPGGAFCSAGLGVVVVGLEEWEACFIQGSASAIGVGGWERVWSSSLRVIQSSWR